MENHIFIGLGGTGTKILQCLKKKVKEEGLENLPWGFVCVDTDDIFIDKNNPICHSEFVRINTSLAKECIEHIDRLPHIKSWFGDKDSWIRLLENYSGHGSMQCRRLGRLLFALHENIFLDCVRRNVTNVQNMSHNHDVKFHIIASCCGGFGSGALLDAISLIRSQYPSEFTLEYPANSIDLFLKTPEVDFSPQKDLGFYEANAYISIKELKGKYMLFTACNLFSNSIETGRTISDDELFDKVAQTLIIFYTQLPERYVLHFGVSSLLYGFKLFGISTISYPVELKCSDRNHLADILEKMKEESAILLNLGSESYTMNKLHKNVLSFLIAPNPKNTKVCNSYFNAESLSAVCDMLYTYNGKQYCLLVDNGYSYDCNKMSIIKMGFAASYDYKEVLKKKYDALIHDENNSEWYKFLLIVQ